MDAQQQNNLSATVMMHAIKAPTTLTNLQRGNTEQETPSLNHEKSLHEMAAQGELQASDLININTTNNNSKQQQIYVDLLDDESLTPLMYASYFGQWTTAELLLAHKANVNYCSSAGQTPLMFAAAGKHSQVVKVLLKAGALVNCVDKLGNSALHHAANANAASVVKQLLNNGADMHIKNSYGQIAFQVCVDKNSVDSLEVFNNYLRATLNC